MSIRNSILKFFRRSDVDALLIERIRSAMLNALDQHCVETHDSVGRSIKCANDIEALWYLRSDLFHAIASCRHQSSAMAIVSEITIMFKGHFAMADFSRFSYR
jgi:hypothetical protein